jgi:hypothetical protein
LFLIAGQGTMADANVEDAGELRWTQCLILYGSQPGQMIFNDVLGRTVQDDEVRNKIDQQAVLYEILAT